MKQFTNGRLFLNVIFFFFCLTIFNIWSDSIDSTALSGGHVCVGSCSQPYLSDAAKVRERVRFPLKFVEVPLADNKSSNWKKCCHNEFPKQAANADHMPTVQCGYLVTSLPLSSQPVCTHSHRHVLQPHPNNSLQNRETLGDWHPPPLPHLPLYTPFSSSPSTPTDPLSGGPLFTFTLLHGPAGLGGRAESLHYCLVLPCIPPPLPTWPDPIHRPQKHHLYDPTVREWGREGRRKKGNENKAGRKEMTAENGGKGIGERERRRGISKGAALTVLKYPSKSFHHMKVFCYFSFFRHGAYWFFSPLPPFIFSFNFSFQNLLILHALCVLNFSQTILYSWSHDPLLCFFILPSITLLLHPSSCYSVAQAFQGLLSAHICEEGGFSHGAAGENWDSLCSLRDAICPCCLRGVLSPLLLPPSIHPTLCPSTPRCSLMLIYRAESPRNVLPISLPPFSSSPPHAPPCPITNSFLALPSFSSHLPTHSACFPTHPAHLSPISLCS